MSWNTTCNSTLEELRIGSEEKIAGDLTFHQLALLIGGVSAAIAILLSFYLMWRHASNYTKPREQKHIIRILFMIPVYATSAFLCIWYYWHAVYFQVMSDCYEAFAISSFFALMCHYMAPDLHEQKDFFRTMNPIKPWVWPVNWFAKCCGGERGPWRIPKSGLTWFNIIWIGIYHYCFIRVTMTITAVLTQYFDRYCESSNSPVFAHIWVVGVESVAVSIAMYCVIQFYVQLREPLAEHSPFLKVLAIKLVIFLSFWQTVAISVGTSTLHIIEANSVMAYPDIKVGLPSLLLCVEMALFALLHQWAFPYQPYKPGAKPTFYPVADASLGGSHLENEHETPRGVWKAFGDALNLWDIVKAFGRGMRWLFVGVKSRHHDASYQPKGGHNSLDTSYPMKSYPMSAGPKSTDHLPIATEFRRSKFGMGLPQKKDDEPVAGDESAGLIENAQSFSVPTSPPRSEERAPSPYHRQPSPYHDPHRGEYYEGPTSSSYENHAPPLSPAYQAYQPYSEDATDRGSSPYLQQGSSQKWSEPSGSAKQANHRTSTQLRVGNALWGDRSPQYDGRQ
ncbi:organic solute transporter Ostalpha-domain-containing protein [Pseudomassariella vexata]|uniref:Organic solute transporter Ostalpha-domain-containing protein n=1 Tax=Pseudomassariella vexata TaxID=1141098 RepID=A0A1Y2E1N0_9PEZI|nr:organic solute transporter Ostalpha-domain-containing protein [Pseudomassariella vexata]ORY65226.1 organic solute transporter Ostalpha-domain-containing protein [Pseudomassariella vexata]